MTRAALVAAAVASALAAHPARANRIPDWEGSFHSALAKGNADELEEIGAAGLATRWSDDAWSEAAHLAERRGDIARARRDLQQLLAIEPKLVARGMGDDQLARRARLDLERYERIVGDSDEWLAVAAAHDQIISRLHSSGDPTPALRDLEILVHDHPRYPRAAAAMLALAGGWEREGEQARAVHWLIEADRAFATDADRLRARAELVRTLVRAGDLDAADARLQTMSAGLAAAPPSGLVESLRVQLASARLRRHLRWLTWLALAVIAALAGFALRRSAPSWRAAVRRLAPPPAEAVFFLPLGAVLVIVAYTGNPLVGRAVRTIALSGIATSWLSGAILAGRAVRLRRALVHAVCSAVAVSAATYLAVDDGHLINFVIETWREGPAG